LSAATVLKIHYPCFCQSLPAPTSCMLLLEWHEGCVLIETMPSLLPNRAVVRRKMQAAAEAGFCPCGLVARCRRLPITELASERKIELPCSSCNTCTRVSGVCQLSVRRKAAFRHEVSLTRQARLQIAKESGLGLSGWPASHPR
jgi:hypothetical protein